jgi:hypothetical protein
MKFIYLILLLYIPKLLTAQFEDYSQKKFTIRDGLPSNECHDVIQDSIGYIWIATDRGLSRYDGYEFMNFTIQDGLQNVSCMEIFLDNKQNIWISTFGSGIFIYNREKDKIEEYEYNHIIKNTSKFEHIKKVFVDDSGKFFALIDGTGILEIDLEGNVEKTNTSNQTPLINIKRIKNDILVGRSFSTITGGGTPHLEASRIENDDIIIVNTLFNPDYNFSDTRNGFKLDIDWEIINLYGVQYFFKNKNLHHRRLENAFLDLLKTRKGKILTTNKFYEGLKLYDSLNSFLKNDYQILIENISGSRLLEDRNNNIWISTLENGLICLEKKEIQIFQNQRTRISEIECSDEDVYMVKDKFQLEILSPLSGNSTSINVDKSEISTIKYNDKLKSLLIGSSKNSYKFDGKLSPIKNSTMYSAAASSIENLKSNKISLLGGNRIYIYEAIDKVQNQIIPDSIIPYKKRTICDFINGNYLIGTLNGLFEYDVKLNIAKQLEGHKVFHSRIENLIKHENYYYIGTIGLGLVIWDGGNNYIEVGNNKGLISNNVENLFIADNNDIFVCTYHGLSRVRLANDSIYSIINYTTINGLPSNEVVDIDQLGDTLFIGTGAGLAKLSLGDEDSIKTNQPLLEYITINGKDKRNSFKEVFNYDENNIDIHFKTIDLSLYGDIKYRYILNQENSIEFKSTNINLVSLSPGKYAFKVQSQNKVGVWGEFSTFSFKINPPWWKSWWFYSLAALSLIMMSLYQYSLRINKLKHEAKIDEELRELEKAALQAQMNPHFIFNCLNSIQNFIIDNEKEKAMDYLSRFAKLIRQTLNASVESRISLEDEIKMLHNYLDLEKLRFKDKFTFKINVGDDIDIKNTKISPLLIQPFVENAVLHGMNTLDVNGKINVKFSRIDNTLFIEIADNGRKAVEIANTKEHKSLGVSITQKRLTLLNGKNTIIKQESSNSGKTVTIQFKLEN